MEKTKRIPKKRFSRDFFNALASHMATEVHNLEKDELLAVRKYAKSMNHTNCWYRSYYIKDVVIGIINDELEIRKINAKAAKHRRIEGVDGRPVTIENRFCVIDGRDEWTATAETKIKAVWQAVVEFIQWYNNTQTPKQ